METDPSPVGSVEKVGEAIAAYGSGQSPHAVLEKLQIVVNGYILANNIWYVLDRVIELSRIVVDFFLQLAKNVFLKLC